MAMPSLLKNPMLSACSCYGGAGRKLARVGGGFLHLGGFGFLVSGGFAGASSGRFASFHFAVELGTLFDGHAVGADIAVNAGRIPDVHTIGAFELSLDTAAHHDFTRSNIGLHSGVGADGKDGVLEIDFALNVAVDEQIFGARDLAFNADALAQAGHRVRRNGSRRANRSLRGRSGGSGSRRGRALLEPVE